MKTALMVTGMHLDQARAECNQAKAERDRLLAQVKDMEDRLTSRNDRIDALQAQVAELLAALERVAALDNGFGVVTGLPLVNAVMDARAAIAKARG